MKLTVAAPFLLLAPALTAQSLLHSHVLPTSWFVRALRGAGDTNGDGRPDFVALVHDQSTTSPVLRLLIVSGATGQPLHNVVIPTQQDERDAFGCGDVNGDNRSDVVALRGLQLRLHSGASGALAWSQGPGTQSMAFVAACAIGDHDGNGAADLAVGIYDSNTGSVILRRLRGENGVQLGAAHTLANASHPLTVRATGDLTGDGKAELAIATDNQTMRVLHGDTWAELWSLTPTGPDAGRTIETLDLDGDGKRELFFFRPQLTAPGVHGLMSVHDPLTGAVRFTRTSPPGGGFGVWIAGVGDLDSDGTQDFAQMRGENGTSHIHAASGVDGRRLWSQPNWSPTFGLDARVAGVGDVDGDGFGDFVQGANNGYVSDGWYVLSGRILAESQPQTGACGGGPFFPRLGATRPILGQTMTIAGQDGPIATPGLVVFSLQPAAPTWLGVSTCFAHFDLGAGIALAPLTQPQWALPVPVPLGPQLAGFALALQAWYAPTTGPLGLDLSNGVHVRLGYQ